MQLDKLTWLEVEQYLARANGVLLATGSIEQHGPIGLIGTDVICANSIANEVAQSTGAMVVPPLTYTPAPFNTSFPGTISISATLFEKIVGEIFAGLQVQGFTKIYVINGHGANLEPLAAAAWHFPANSIKIRSWWSFDAVQTLCKTHYGGWEGMHATPSELAITQHITGIVHEGAESPPEKLSAQFIAEHAGDKHGPPDEHKLLFPDGRVGSHSALATPEHGRQFFEAAVSSIADDYLEFVG